MSGKGLRQLTEKARQELPGTDSLLVVRHGYLVYEQYFRDKDGQALRDLFSVTKSVVSILVGIAIQEGYIEGVDRRALDFFPEMAGPQLDPQAARVSIRYLLTMTDGLSTEWMQTHFDAGTFSEPPRGEPGAHWRYNNLSPQILSNIITRTTGQRALEYGRKRLFDPLGVVRIEWWENDSFAGRDSMGAYGLRLTPRDVAKIGYLMLNGGRWEGRQVVSTDWVSESTRAQMEIGDAVPGFDYGYFWWVHPMAGVGAFCAQGLGGQWICVVPELDIVAVVTTSEVQDSNARKYLALIEDYVLPSVRRNR
jgi:CubicO group peptidase (beta-lactamase class C family)